MLQAVYKTSPYVFYLSTEDKRIDTTKTDTDNLVYLFKLTNDMSGEIQYAFAVNGGGSGSQEIYNRYSRFELLHNTSQLYYSAQVNLVPNGYWNYELYEYSGDITAAVGCTNVPNPATNVLGYYTVTDIIAGTIIATTNITADVYDYTLSDLDESVYQIKLYDNCDRLIQTDGLVVDQFTAQSDDTRWVEIENVDQTSTGISFDVVSNMPIGHSYDFQQGSGSYEQITDITSKPQTTTHTFTQVNPPLHADNLVEMRAYDQTGGNAGGGSLVWGAGNTLDFQPITQPSTYYGLAADVVAIPVSVDSGGAVLSKGSAVITIIYGTTASGTAPGYYSLQGLITQGKLYVSEPSGEEQVQYNQHPEPSGTNYIYYGQ